MSNVKAIFFIILIIAATSLTDIPQSCRSDCQCPPSVPQCLPNVPLVRDGCGCCWHCARQVGQPCSGMKLCDASRNLVCMFEAPSVFQGHCKVMTTKSCQLLNETFHHGETFFTDCRTQCVCQDGTYGCTSLCPNEAVSPGDKCKNPRLVGVPGQCCREWVCDSQNNLENECAPKAGHWTPCSTTRCGLGGSIRWKVDASGCLNHTQGRLCQLRSCEEATRQEDLIMKRILRGNNIHHLRKNRLCKGSERYHKPVRYRIGSCTSEKTYRPKRCSSCPNHCCRASTSTTISVTFICPLHSTPQILTDFISNPQAMQDKSLISLQNEDFTSHDESLFYFIRMNSYERISVSVQWIVKCKCAKSC